MHELRESKLYAMNSIWWCSTLHVFWYRRLATTTVLHPIFTLFTVPVLPVKQLWFFSNDSCRWKCAEYSQCRKTNVTFMRSTVYSEAFWWMHTDSFPFRCTKPLHRKQQSGLCNWWMKYFHEVPNVELVLNIPGYVRPVTGTADSNPAGGMNFFLLGVLCVVR